MLKQRREKQQQMELVIMEQMVPEDHFLRKVDRAVDFSFIYDLKRPAIWRGAQPPDKPLRLCVNAGVRYIRA